MIDVGVTAIVFTACVLPRYSETQRAIGAGGTTLEAPATDSDNGTPDRARVVTRRAILARAGLAIAAVGACGLPTPLYAAPVTVDAFLALSVRLTQTDGLDPAIAARLLEGFLSMDQGAGLQRLIAGGTPSQQDGDLANAIVEAWYSGQYNTPQGPAVATYDGALVWDALPFTKPPTECGGETGYWADPPES